MLTIPLAVECLLCSQISTSQRTHKLIKHNITYLCHSSGIASLDIGLSFSVLREVRVTSSKGGLLDEG